MNNNETLNNVSYYKTLRLVCTFYLESLKNDEILFENLLIDISRLLTEYFILLKLHF